jgi:hypothetical protein
MSHFLNGKNKCLPIIAAFSGETISQTSARHETINSDQTTTIRRDDREIVAETKASNRSGRPVSIRTH